VWCVLSLTVTAASDQDLPCLSTGESGLFQMSGPRISGTFCGPQLWGHWLLGESCCCHIPARSHLGEEAGPCTGVSLLMEDKAVARL
jgi:hypothetical protein